MSGYTHFQEQVIFTIGFSFFFLGLTLMYLTAWVYAIRNSLPRSDELTKSERIIQPRLALAISAIIIIFGQMIFCNLLVPPGLSFNQILWAEIQFCGIGLVIVGVTMPLALHGMRMQNLYYYQSRDPKKRLRFERFWIICGLIVFGIFVILLLFLIWALVF